MPGTTATWEHGRFTEQRYWTAPDHDAQPDAGSERDAVPDFLGLSMRGALEKAQSMRISLKMQGNGYVVKQNPAPGERRQEQQVVVLHLEG